MGDGARSKSIYRWLERVERPRGPFRAAKTLIQPSSMPAPQKPRHEQPRDRLSTTHHTGSPQHLPAQEIGKGQQALQIPAKRKRGPAADSKQSLQRGRHEQSEAAEGGKRRRLAREDDRQAEAVPVSYPTTPTKPSKTNRQRLFLLHDATPSVICQPFGSTKPKPNAVMDLMRVLVQSRNSAMMGSMYRLVKNSYPFEVSSYASKDATPPTPEITELFNAISAGYSQATTDHARFAGKDGWSQVAETILDNALKMSARKQPDTLLNVRRMQTVSISPATLLPTVGGKVLFPNVDHLVSFSLRNENVGTLIGAVKKRLPGLLLSPTEDATVGRKCQLIPVEVKSPDGTYYSSSVHLATWLAASLEKIRQLQELVAAKSGARHAPRLPLPLMGISVVGHNWHLHVAAKAENRDVTVYGPISIGDTLSFDGVFRIFNVITRIENWAREVYWPWLKDTILTPLATLEIGENDG